MARTTWILMCVQIRLRKARVNACYRVAGAVINGSELCVLLAAVVIFLSMLGLNVSSLLIPIGIAIAIAAKDLSHNFLAGFFLFAVQVSTYIGILVMFDVLPVLPVLAQLREHGRPLTR